MGSLGIQLQLQPLRDLLLLPLRDLLLQPLRDLLLQLLRDLLLQLLLWYLLLQLQVHLLPKTLNRANELQLLLRHQFLEPRGENSSSCKITSLVEHICTMVQV